MIISVVSSKGGAGKTTLNAILGANLFTYYGRNVVLFDLDPQKSLVEVRQSDLKEINKKVLNSRIYTTARKNQRQYGKACCDVVSVSSNLTKVSFEEIRRKLSELEKSYEVVIVDFPGSLNINPDILSLLVSIDYFFIPLYVDKMSLKSAYNFYQSLMSLKGEGKIKGTPYFFFNKYTTGKGTNASIFVQVKNLMIDALGLRCMQNHIPQSVKIEDFSTVDVISLGNPISKWVEEIDTIVFQGKIGHLKKSK